MSFRLALGSDPEINLQSPTALKIRLQKDKEAALERRKKEGEAKLKAKQEKVAAARESRKRKKDLEEAKKQKARMAEEAREKEAAKDHPPTKKRPRQNSKGLFYSSLIVYIRPYVYVYIPPQYCTFVCFSVQDPEQDPDAGAACKAKYIWCWCWCQRLAKCF